MMLSIYCAPAFPPFTRSPMKRFTLALLAVASVAALPLAGCDLFGSGSGPEFRLRMTDDPFPFDLADSAVVTIRRIELRGEDGVEPFTFFDGPETVFNLLDFQNGLDTTLGLATLPTSGYNQVRIIVGPGAYVVLNDGTVHPLRVPSGEQTGIKINLPAVAADEAADTVDLLVDFDVESSFHTTGNPDNPQGLRFSFRPVIRIESLEVDGAPVASDDLPNGGEGEIDEGG